MIIFFGTFLIPPYLNPKYIITIPVQRMNLSCGNLNLNVKPLNHLLTVTCRARNMELKYYYGTHFLSVFQRKYKQFILMQWYTQFIQGVKKYLTFFIVHNFAHGKRVIHIDLNVDSRQVYNFIGINMVPFPYLLPTLFQSVFLFCLLYCIFCVAVIHFVIIFHVKHCQIHYHKISYQTLS